MSVIQAVRPHPFRHSRYVVAAALGGVVALLVALASIANALFSGHAVLVFACGVPALALAIAGTVIGIRGLGARGQVGRSERIWAAALLLAGFILWVFVAESSWLLEQGPVTVVIASAIACLPTTSFGLFVLRRLDRNEKEPWRLMLVAVVWGAVIATTLAAWGNTLWDLFISYGLPPGPASNQSTGFSAGIVEELSKGLAVVLLYLIMRGEFDDVVDGIIYGAAVGMGFNYCESILYMSRIYVELQQMGQPGAAGVAAQWFFRQVLDLFTGHATYTAMVGAGLGIARQMPRMHQRVLAILAGFLSAMAAHMVFDAWIASAPGGLLFVVIREVVGGGAFTAVVLLILAMGTRNESRALEEHLRLEASENRGTVLPQEVELLISPSRRFWERYEVLFHRGIGGWRRLTHLRNAQLDLAMERWHRARHEIDQPLEAEELLRERVRNLRAAYLTGARPARA
ncbi:MAG TPA: PrsW family intramembrane metalloprotease [Candidatus Dormibacteraeota bacterium]|jgi:RsiW-degrading membrane proteinase PrsW (M82 family)|nr:PrsW family intramembrane metalloprotease [Candidatus Dormibacteraeota bacterium]